MRPSTTIVLLIGLTSSARAQDCPPAAFVEGPGEIVASIRTELEARGVSAQAREGCPRATIRVERAGELLRLRMRDDDGRQSDREIRDVATATALIDSFSRHEVLEPILGMPPEPLAEPAPVAAAAVTAAAAPATGLSARMESSVATDASTWMGAALTGCVRLGPVCAGGLFRAGADTGWTTPSSHDRYGLDLLATAELPISVAGFVIAPSAGMGVGWTRATVTMPDPHDPHLTVTETREGGGLRLGAHLTVARPLGGGFAVELDVGLDGSLFRGQEQPPAFARAAAGLRWGGR